MQQCGQCLWLFKDIKEKKIFSLKQNVIYCSMIQLVVIVNLYLSIGVATV